MAASLVRRVGRDAVVVVGTFSTCFAVGDFGSCNADFLATDLVNLISVWSSFLIAFAFVRLAASGLRIDDGFVTVLTAGLVERVTTLVGSLRLVRFVEDRVDFLFRVVSWILCL